ncbi:MAG: FAD-binding oxidoreductase [Candidatus Lokiarchaeota archaeon]|nr:FAD-binding oxidoreductase [Candidatus Lokiarchaeota archaeon]
MEKLTDRKRSEIKGRLEGIFGPENVTDKVHDLFPYSYDATECEPHMPDFVVLPEYVDQVVAVVKLASESGVPLVPYISGNNIGGLTIPERGGIVVDFSKRMNRILHVHESHMYAILEPGVTFGQLKKHLDDHHPGLRYSYPFAPPFSGAVGNAMLSGMNNMSCAHGSMGDWINGVEVVLHDGTVARVGSCFLGKEFRPDNWHSRYPMPDLLGMFVNWQGMTGIVTKCAVQLWPRRPIETAYVGIAYGFETTAELMRELGRAEVIDDISAVSVEVAKMSVGIPTPIKIPEEPDFALLVPVSALTRKHLEAKYEIIQDVFAKVNRKHGNKTFITKFDTFASLVGEGVRAFYDLPGVVTPLVEYSGLTWFGSYAPPEHLGTLFEKANAIFHKYNFPAFVYSKIMKSGHYGIFRSIIRYKKDSEEDRAHRAMEEFFDLGVEHGCIPYKAPVWMCERLKEHIDPNWLELFKRVKGLMDPKGILNPGRWGV